MVNFYKEGLHNEKGYRLRCMKSLIEQLKMDYINLNGSIRSFKSEELDISETDKILQKISWIKQEINMLKKLDNKNIEGVLSGEIVDIEKQVIYMEMNIKLLHISHFM